MFKNILKAQLKICKYSRNNQKSYDDAFNQLEYKRLRLSQNSLSILFSQCKVSLCERNTHDVGSLLANFGENCCSISAQKTTKQIFFTICWQSENADSDLQVCALHYANELLVRVRLPFKNFCKVAKRAETTRNYQNRFWLRLITFWQTHKLTRYRSKQFSYRTNTKVYAYN